MDMENKTKGRIIQLPHFIWYLLLQMVRKWKYVLAGVLIFALAAGGLVFVKNRLEAKEKTDFSKVSVTEVELENVLNAADAYDKFSEQQEYIEQSYLMKCTGLKKSEAVAVCSVDAESESLQSKITNVYLNYFEGEEIYEKIIHELNLDIGQQYVKEMFSYSCLDNFVFQITVTSYSRENAIEVLQQAEKYLQSKQKTLEEKFGVNCEIQILSEECSDVLDISIREQKDLAKTSLETYQKSYEAILPTLTENERRYYDNYINQREREDYVLGQELVVDRQEMPMEVRTGLSLKKGVCIGAVLGFFCICFVFVVRYFFTSRLMNGTEVSLLYGITILGMALKKKHYGKLETWIMKKQNSGAEIKNFEEECKEIIMRICLQYSEKDKIYISGTQAEQGEYADILIREGKKKGISFVQGKNLSEIASDISEVKEADAILLIEEEGSSKYQDIEKEIDILKEAGKKICGMVIMVG